MTVSSNDRIGPVPAGIGPRLARVAACTLGLVLALGLAELTGLLAFDEAAAALGFVAGGGLIGSMMVRLGPRQG
jgi:hypothetical protein